MTNEREYTGLSEFLQFLAKESCDGEQLPSLVNLSQQLKVSTTSLREQLEVARALGLVDVRPRTGIRRRPYHFAPAVLKSLSYAAAVDAEFYFQAFSDLRNHIEAAYFRQAVGLLVDEDHLRLRSLVAQAMQKLAGSPIQIPHEEHRELHLSIYRRLNNPFVTGLLEAYWEAYEAFGLSVYTDLSYLQNVWQHHSKMVDAVCGGKPDEAYQILMDHTALISHRSRPAPTGAAVPKVFFRQEFE